MNLVRLNAPVGRVYTDHLVNDLFHQLWNTDRQLKQCVAEPASNLYEADAEIRLELLVPGFDRNEISISVEKDRLIVKGEVKQDEKTEYKQSRIGFVKSNFEKNYKILENLDKEGIKAEFRNGILSIVFPKVEEEKQKVVRKIEIE